MSTRAEKHLFIPFSPSFLGDENEICRRRMVIPSALTFRFRSVNVKSDDN
jgi:hypothetical protein